MGIMRRIYDSLAWYPWLSTVCRDYLSGNLNERLPIQKPQNRPLSIILNGPSVNRTLNYLKRETTDVCMVNHAIVTDLYKKIKPEYVCLADPYYFVNNKEVYGIYETMREVNPNQIVFYPKGRNISFIKKGNMQFRRVYTTDRLYNVDQYSIKLLKKNLMAPSFITVAIMALYVGIQMGYKEIYLYGADFSFIKGYTVTDDLKVCMDFPHYYGKGKIYVENMKAEIGALQTAYSQCYIMADYAKKENVKILNMSDESMLDCFERYKY